MLFYIVLRMFEKRKKRKKFEKAGGQKTENGHF
jgi:hypothetical protein